jgi:hypothetical protein
MFRQRLDLKSFLYIIAGALFLMLPAFINGYPIIYSDTSTYIHSGFILQPPMDRPITYGLFIRLASLNGTTLWTVVFLQTLLLSWLLYLFAKKSEKSVQKDPGLLFAGIIVVSSLSGAAWTSSFLLPDIFTPIMLLAALLLLAYPEKERRTIWLWITFGFSAAMHSSHIPFGIALLSIILVARLLFPVWLKAQLRIRTLIILIGVTLASIGIMSSSLSKSKHVFQMGAYIEQGIIGPYLDQECQDHDYELCAYKDSLPDQAWQFIWEETSPLYLMGGWKASKAEFNEIIRATWTSPRFLAMHLKASITSTVKQLLSFQSVFVHGVSPNIDQLGSRIEEFIPGDLKAFQTSRQNTGPLTAFAWLNPVQLSLLILALVLIPGLLLCQPSLRQKKILMLTGVLLVLGIVIHAWVCGTFANPVDRLGNKMIWILPSYALILIFQAVSKGEESCLKSH